MGLNSVASLSFCLAITLVVLSQVESKFHIFHTHHIIRHQPKNKTQTPAVKYQYEYHDFFHKPNEVESVYNISSDLITDCAPKIQEAICVNTTAVCLANGMIFCTAEIGNTVRCTMNNNINCVLASTNCGKNIILCNQMLKVQIPCISTVDIYNYNLSNTNQAYKKSRCATVVSIAKKKI